MRKTDMPDSPPPDTSPSGHRGKCKPRAKQKSPRSINKEDAEKASGCASKESESVSTNPATNNDKDVGVPATRIDTAVQSSGPEFGSLNNRVKLYRVKPGTGYSNFPQLPSSGSTEGKVRTSLGPTTTFGIQWVVSGTENKVPLFPSFYFPYHRPQSNIQEMHNREQDTSDGVTKKLHTGSSSQQENFCLTLQKPPSTSPSSSGNSRNEALGAVNHSLGYMLDSVFNLVDHSTGSDTKRNDFQLENKNKMIEMKNTDLQVPQNGCPHQTILHETDASKCDSSCTLCRVPASDLTPCKSVFTPTIPSDFNKMCDVLMCNKPCNDIIPTYAHSDAYPPFLKFLTSTTHDNGIVDKLDKKLVQETGEQSSNGAPKELRTEQRENNASSGLTNCIQPLPNISSDDENRAKCIILQKLSPVKHCKQKFKITKSSLSIPCSLPRKKGSVALNLLSKKLPALTGKKVRELTNSFNKFVFCFEPVQCLKSPDGQKLYVCDICSSDYKTSFNLKRHYLKSHVNYRYLSEQDFSSCCKVVGNKMAIPAEENSICNSKVSPDKEGVIPEESKIDSTASNPQNEVSCPIKEGESTRASSEKISSQEITFPDLYQCRLCGTFYDVKEELKVHLTTVPQHVCKQCNMIIIDKYSFLRHSSVHQSEDMSAIKIHYCLFCNKRFKNAAIRKRHQSRVHDPLQKHATKKNFHYCPFCKKAEKFKELPTLMTHLMCVHSDEYFACLLCKLRFDSKENLQWHKEKKHSDLSPETNSEQNESRLNVAEKVVIETDGLSTAKENSCVSNSQIYVSPATNEFSNSCPVCQKMFTNPVNMSRHKRLAHVRATSKPKKLKKPLGVAETGVSITQVDENKISAIASSEVFQKSQDSKEDLNEVLSDSMSISEIQERKNILVSSLRTIPLLPENKCLKIDQVVKTVKPWKGNIKIKRLPAKPHLKSIKLKQDFDNSENMVIKVARTKAKKSLTHGVATVPYSDNQTIDMPQLIDINNRNPENQKSDYAVPEANNVALPQYLINQAPDDGEGVSGPISNVGNRKVQKPRCGNVKGNELPKKSRKSQKSTKEKGDNPSVESKSAVNDVHFNNQENVFTEQHPESQKLQKFVESTFDNEDLKLHNIISMPHQNNVNAEIQLPKDLKIEGKNISVLNSVEKPKKIKLSAQRKGVPADSKKGETAKFQNTLRRKRGGTKVNAKSQKVQPQKIVEGKEEVKQDSQLLENVAEKIFLDDLIEPQKCVLTKSRSRKKRGKVKVSSKSTSKSQSVKVTQGDVLYKSTVKSQSAKCKINDLSYRLFQHPQSMSIKAEMDEECIFYSNITSNIRENLLNHLDGKLDASGNPCIAPVVERTIANDRPKRREKPTYKLDAAFNGFINDIKPPFVDHVGIKSETNQENHIRHWVSWEKYNFPKNYDDRAAGMTTFVKDMSYFDISTQMRVRQNLERLNSEIPSSHDVDELEEVKVEGLPRNLCLMENSSSFTEKFAEKGQLDLFHLGLCRSNSSTSVSASHGDVPGKRRSLRRKSLRDLHSPTDSRQGNSKSLLKDDSVNVAELSREWVRPRRYICGVCCDPFTDLIELEDHKYFFHPNVWCTHFDFDEAAISEISPASSPHASFPTKSLRRSLLANGTLYTADVVPPVSVPELPCTKCKKCCSTIPELHHHMLECGGDTPWMLTMVTLSPGGPRKNKKWGPFVSRKRKNHSQHGMKRNIPNSPIKMPNFRSKTRNADGDTIQRMMANLPPKRVRRAVQFKEEEMRTRSRATKHSIPKCLESGVETEGVVLTGKQSSAFKIVEECSEVNNNISKSQLEENVSVVKVDHSEYISVDSTKPMQAAELLSNLTLEKSLTSPKKKNASMGKHKKSLVSRDTSQLTVPVIAESPLSQNLVSRDTLGALGNPSVNELSFKKNTVKREITVQRKTASKKKIASAENIESFTFHNKEKVKLLDYIQVNSFGLVTDFHDSEVHNKKFRRKTMKSNRRTSVTKEKNSSDTENEKHVTSIESKLDYNPSQALLTHQDNFIVNEMKVSDNGCDNFMSQKNDQVNLNVTFEKIVDCADTVKHESENNKGRGGSKKIVNELNKDINFSDAAIPTKSSCSTERNVEYFVEKSEITASLNFKLQVTETIKNGNCSLVDKDTNSSRKPPSLKESAVSDLSIMTMTSSISYIGPKSPTEGEIKPVVSGDNITPVNTPGKEVTRELRKFRRRQERFAPEPAMKIERASRSTRWNASYEELYTSSDVPSDSDFENEFDRLVEFNHQKVISRKRGNRTKIARNRGRSWRKSLRKVAVMKRHTDVPHGKEAYVSDYKSDLLKNMFLIGAQNAPIEDSSFTETMDTVNDDTTHGTDFSKSTCVKQSFESCANEVKEGDFIQGEYNISENVPVITSNSDFEKSEFLTEDAGEPDNFFQSDSNVPTIMSNFGSEKLNCTAHEVENNLLEDKEETSLQTLIPTVRHDSISSIKDQKKTPKRRIKQNSSQKNENTFRKSVQEGFDDYPTLHLDIIKQSPLKVPQYKTGVIRSQIRKRRPSRNIQRQNNKMKCRSKWVEEFTRPAKSYRQLNKVEESLRHMPLEELQLSDSYNPEDIVEQVSLVINKPEEVDNINFVPNLETVGNNTDFTLTADVVTDNESYATVCHDVNDEIIPCLKEQAELTSCLKEQAVHENDYICTKSNLDIELESLVCNTFNSDKSGQCKGKGTKNKKNYCQVKKKHSKTKKKNSKVRNYLTHNFDVTEFQNTCQENKSNEYSSEKCHNNDERLIVTKIIESPQEQRNVSNYPCTKMEEQTKETIIYKDQRKGDHNENYFQNKTEYSDDGRPNFILCESRFYEIKELLVSDDSESRKSYKECIDESYADLRRKDITPYETQGDDEQPEKFDDTEVPEKAEEDVLNLKSTKRLHLLNKEDKSVDLLNVINMSEYVVKDDKLKDDKVPPWSQPTPDMHYFNSSHPVQPCGSLGSILDSVNQVSDDGRNFTAESSPATTMDSYYDYSDLTAEHQQVFSMLMQPSGFKELQQAMGATDEEMALIQQLGEIYWPIENAEVSDNQKKEEAKEEPAQTPNMTEMMKNRLKKQASLLLAPCHMWRNVEEEKTKPSILSQYITKKIVCPLCNKSFLSLTALQVYTSVDHEECEKHMKNTNKQASKALISSFSETILPQRQHMYTICKELHSDNDSLVSHMKTKHGSDAPIHCPSAEDPKIGEGLKSHISSILVDLLNRAKVSMAHIASENLQQQQQQPKLNDDLFSKVAVSDESCGSSQLDKDFTYTCQICKEKFYSLSAKYSHFMNVHPRHTETCSSPSLSHNFDSVDYYSDDHEKLDLDISCAVDLEDESSFLCSDCGINFKTPCEVIEHRALEYPSLTAASQECSTSEQEQQSQDSYKVRRNNSSECTRENSGVTRSEVSNNRANVASKHLKRKESESDTETNQNILSNETVNSNQVISNTLPSLSVNRPAVKRKRGRHTATHAQKKEVALSSSSVIKEFIKKNKMIEQNKKLNGTRRQSLEKKEVQPVNISITENVKKSSRRHVKKVSYEEIPESELSAVEDAEDEASIDSINSVPHLKWSENLKKKIQETMDQIQIDSSLSSSDVGISRGKRSTKQQKRKIKPQVLEYSIVHKTGKPSNKLSIFKDRIFKTKDSKASVPSSGNYTVTDDDDEDDDESEDNSNLNAKKYKKMSYKYLSKYYN